MVVVLVTLESQILLPASDTWRCVTSRATHGSLAPPRLHH